MERLTGSEARSLMEAYQAVYAPQQLSEEVEIAAQYFYDLGLNEDGVEIVIEELGVDEFSEWIYELAEEYVLTEEETRLQQKGALKGPKGSKPQSTTKARVKAQGGVEMKTSARPESTVRPGKRTAAVEKAKEEQPQKKGGLGAIADRVRKGMERHNKAVADTKKTIGKAAKGVGHVAREFGKGVTGAAKFAGAVAREVTKEEVEEWVNSLVEEGYDLSEYTWEDMYEAYITEIGVNFGGQAAVDRVRAKAATERASSSKLDAARTQRFGSGGSPSAGKDKSGNVSKPAAPTSGDYKSRFAGARDAAFTRARQIQGSPVVGPRVAAPAAAPAAAPKPTGAPKPAPSAPKPTPTKPATGMLGKTSFERRTPTSAELKAAQAARASGASPEKTLQAAKSAGTMAKVQSAGQSLGAKAFSSPTIGAAAFKPATPSQATAAAPSTSAAASGSVVAPTAKIASAPKPITMGSKKPGSTFEQYDAYDLVLEYLLSEGHVETLEEALYVMMEMDSETIQSICGTYH